MHAHICLNCTPERSLCYIIVQAADTPQTKSSQPTGVKVYTCFQIQHHDSNSQYISTNCNEIPRWKISLKCNFY